MNQRLLAVLYAALAMIPLKSIMAAETGSAMSDCTLTSLTDKQPYNLHQFKGKVIYVDFWASWCGPCAKSFPFMNELSRDFKDKGLQVVGINLDEAPADAQSFLVRYPASFTITADTNGQCAKDFGVQAMPSTYLVDRKGTIRHVHLGFRAGEAMEFRALVEQLLAETSADH
jgi:DsbE subfamily thiol:disulfide oxidoreductase